MRLPQPHNLAGRYASLVPLSLEHAASLGLASDTGGLHQLWFTDIPSPLTMEDNIRWRLEQQAKGTMVPFTVLNAEGTPVGMTTYANIDDASPRVEIGYTWYAKQVQRTALNTQIKRLMLAHAFEVWDCIAVEFRTSSFNHASRRAIERLGAKLDGVLRSHRHHRNGTLRDTYVYSIIAAEWPSVRAHLDALLAHYD